MSPTPAPQPRTLQALRTAVLVLAIFLIAAVVVWIVDGSGGGGEEEAAEAPPAGAPYEVEVYDPKPTTAFEVALSPKLRPVPTG
jgi:hypothetical protein